MLKAIPSFGYSLISTFTFSEIIETLYKLKKNYTVFFLRPFNKKSDIWLATISATTIEASVVEAAIWGVNITFGLLNKIF